MHCVGAIQYLYVELSISVLVQAVNHSLKPGLSRAHVYAAGRDANQGSTLNLGGARSLDRARCLHALLSVRDGIQTFFYESAADCQRRLEQLDTLLLDQFVCTPHSHLSPLTALGLTMAAAKKDLQTAHQSPQCHAPFFITQIIHITAAIKKGCNPSSCMEGCEELRRVDTACLLDNCILTSVTDFY